MSNNKTPKNQTILQLKQVHKLIIVLKFLQDGNSNNISHNYAYYFWLLNFYFYLWFRPWGTDLA